MSKLLTTEEFINRAKKIHGNKYDYSKVNYINSTTKVCIICPIHGEFWQTPKGHLNGQRCPFCYKTHKKSNEEFIQQAKEVHDDKYDYSKVDYVNNSTKVCIICPKHGEFWQMPNNHLQGRGCYKCKREKNKKRLLSTTEEFIRKAKEVHGNKYDYSKVNYINSTTKVCIICPIHGEFWQKPSLHLLGHGCYKCGIEKIKKCKKLHLEEFIEKAKEVHGNKYDYSKVNYINSRTKICIICSIHGEFWQKANDHISNNAGCPKCKSSHLEEEMRLFLQENNIKFEEQKRFKWLGRQSLDFYLSDYNIAIECQGKQHFGMGGWMWKEKNYDILLERDRKKNKLCKEKNIKVLYYSNLNIAYPYYVFENKKELLKEIINSQLPPPKGGSLLV